MKSACSLIALLVVTAAGAFAQTGAPPRQGTPKSNKAAAIEQALIEHACRSQLPGVAGEEAYQECLSTRLRSLRADFGCDLARVSAAQRKAVDSACSAARAAEGCGAYLECLTLQLVSIRDRRSKANPSAPQEPVDLSPPESAQLPSLAVPAGETSSWLSPLWIGVTLVALVAVCGGALLAVKGRAATRRCRRCLGRRVINSSFPSQTATGSTSGASDRWRSPRRRPRLPAGTFGRRAVGRPTSAGSAGGSSRSRVRRPSERRARTLGRRSKNATATTQGS